MTLSELFLKGSFPYKGKHVEPLETEKGVCFRHKKLVWRCFDFLSESNIIVTKTCETPDFINFVLIKEIIIICEYGCKGTAAASLLAGSCFLLMNDGMGFIICNIIGRREQNEKQ